MVERYDVEEKDSETSCVLETSQSLTKTLGTKDTQTSSKIATKDRDIQGKKKKTFAFFFRATEIATRGSHCTRWKTNKVWLKLIIIM